MVASYSTVRTNVWKTTIQDVESFHMTLIKENEEIDSNIIHHMTLIKENKEIDSNIIRHIYIQLCLVGTELQCNTFFS